MIDIRVTSIRSIVRARNKFETFKRNRRSDVPGASTGALISYSFRYGRACLAQRAMDRTPDVESQDAEGTSNPGSFLG